jgi:hypothetical protein
VSTVPTTIDFTESEESGILVREGTFTWTGAPAGTGYTAVEFTCDGVTWAAMPASGSCAATSELLQWPTLEVRVTTPAGTYYDEFSGRDH